MGWILLRSYIFLSALKCLHIRNPRADYTPLSSHSLAVEAHFKSRISSLQDLLCICGAGALISVFKIVIIDISFLIMGYFFWYRIGVSFGFLAWELRRSHFPICCGFDLDATNVSSVLFLVDAVRSSATHLILTIVSRQQLLSPWALPYCLSFSIIGVALGANNFSIGVFKENGSITMQWDFTIIIQSILYYLHSFFCISWWSYIWWFLMNVINMNWVLEPIRALALWIVRHFEHMLALQQGDTLSFIWLVWGSISILPRLRLEAPCLVLLLVILSWVLH